MKYWKVKEVSKRLEISLSLVYREIRSGRLPCHRFGKRTYRISEEDLAEYEASRKSRGDSEAPSGGSGVKRPSEFKHIDVSRLLS